jgi:hypothetical protein
MEGPKTLVCFSKFPWARERIPSKFIDNLGTRPQKGSPALVYKVTSITIVIMWSIPTRSKVIIGLITDLQLSPNHPLDVKSPSLCVIRPHYVIGCGERRDLLRIATTGELFADVLADYSWLSGSFKSIFIITIRL